MWRRAIIATTTTALLFAACDGGGGPTASPDAAVIDAAVIDAAAIDAVPAVNLTVARTGAGTVVSQPPGIACGATCTAPFLVDTPVRLTATAPNGVTFVGWSGACAGTGTCDLTIAGDTTVTATFTGVPCDDECTVGATECPIPSEERTCGQYDGDACTEWSPATACSMGEECRLGRCGGAHPLTVSSVREGPIGDAIVTSSPAGILCGPFAPTCQAYFPDGGDVTLTASSDDAAAFDGWAVSPGSNGAHCVGSIAPCTVTMTEATSLEARFCWPSCTAGEVQCHGWTSASTCGNYDADRCLELSPQTACPDGTLCTPGGGCEPAFLATATTAGAPGQVALDAFVCSSCSKASPAGTPVVVSALPASYTLFTGWSGACAGMGPCVLTSTGTAIANFADRCAATLTPNQGDAASLRIGADHVYWIGPHDMTRTAMRKAKGGAAPEALATAFATYLIVDDPHVYWVRGGTTSTIERYSAGVTVPIVTDTFIQHIAVNPTYLFYQRSTTLQRIVKAGGAPVQLAASLPSPVHALLADETHAYWFGGGRVVAVPVDGGAPLVLAMGQGTLGEVTQDATHLYWVGFDKIARMPKTGGAVETLVTTYGTDSIAVHGDTLVWIGVATYATQIGSGVIQMLSMAEASANRQIALDEDAIYLIDARTSNDTIVELARSQTCAPN